jgi:hypothetical protein
MINGIVLVLGKKPEEIKPGYVQGASLLFVAFFALGLDAFLFGLVTGDSACRRAWTEAMFAAGLLGIGTAAIIGGFIYLFTFYFHDVPQTKDLEWGVS